MDKRVRVRIYLIVRVLIRPKPGKKNLFHVDGFYRTLIHTAFAVNAGISINHSQIILHSDGCAWTDINTILTACTFLFIDNSYQSDSSNIYFY